MMIRLDAPNGTQSTAERDRDERLSHWFTAALDVGAALADMLSETKLKITEDSLISNVQGQIARLFHFDAIAFALVDEENSDFNISQCSPPECRDELIREMNRRIEDGHFAWTLRQVRPVILPTADRNVMFLMCSLATRNRVRGMFLGLFSSGTAEISEAALNLLLIILANTANALESIILYRLVKQQNDDLEQRVADRTRELEVALRDADAANRSKSAFIANMSHEIRTPLTSIIGYADLLRQGAIPVMERDVAVDSINRAGRHLLQLVNDILDMSKIESGRVETERVTVDVRQMFADVESIFGPQAKKKGLEFRCDLVAPIPVSMVTDPLRLRQILINLIGNAVKFTENGEVSVVVRGVDEGRTLQIEIADTGIGIPKDRCDALFQPFHQSDASVTRRFGGTGLGLYLARQYTELLGGELTLDQQYMDGTRFRVVLPVLVHAGAAEEPPEDLIEKQDVPGGSIHGRVLIVDDTPENRHLIGLYLHAIVPEVVVETAVNGKEAVERALADPFDLIFMDLQMPELDGMSATQLLRRAGYRGVIAALTASAMEEERPHCIAAGCDDFIVKPLDEQALRRVVHRYLAKAGETVIGRKQVDVEDMPEYRKLREQFMEGLGATMETLQEALERGDFSEIAKAAHKLKGTGASFGYPMLTESAAELEQAARDGATASLHAAFEKLLHHTTVVQD